MRSRCSGRTRRMPWRPVIEPEEFDGCNCNDSREIDVLFAGVVIATIPCPNCTREG